MITFKQTGNFKNAEKFLSKATSINYFNILENYGQQGVDALSSATPIDSGETANAWSYKIIHDQKGIRLEWLNSHVVDGVPIAVLLQYGHGTRNGGYVQGRDYINPAIQPLFDKIATDLWREVVK